MASYNTPVKHDAPPVVGGELADVPTRALRLIVTPPDTPEAKPLNRSQVNMLSRIYGPAEIAVIDQLSLEERLDLTSQLAAMYVDTPGKTIKSEGRKIRAGYLVDFMEGKSYAEIAEAEGCHERNIYRRLKTVFEVLNKQPKEKLTGIIPKPEKDDIAAPAVAPVQDSVLHDYDLRRLNDQELAKRAEHGDAHAMDQLVREYAPLARSLARKHLNGREALEDLEQVARLGLLKAISGFDKSKGASFNTYAHTRMKGELQHYLRDHSWPVHVPRPIKEKALALKAAMEKRTQSGQDVSLEQLAVELGMSDIAAYEAWCALENGNFTDSLDAPNKTVFADEDQDESLVNTIPGADNETTIHERALVNIRLNAVRRSVSRRDWKVFVRHHILEDLQASIAKDMGISQMQVSRIGRKTWSMFCDDKPAA